MLNPNSLAAAVLADPAASFALKDAVRAFIERDPVDALNDAETLRAVMKDKLSHVTGRAPRASSEWSDEAIEKMRRLGLLTAAAESTNNAGQGA